MSRERVGHARPAIRASHIRPVGAGAGSGYRIRPVPSVCAATLPRRRCLAGPSSPGGRAGGRAGAVWTGPRQGSVRTRPSLPGPGSEPGAESGNADGAGASLDAAGMVRSIVMSRLRDPKVAVPLAAVGILLLMRAGGRRRQSEGRLTVDEFERLLDVVERRLTARS